MATKVVMIHMKWASMRLCTAWICSPRERGLVDAVMNGPYLVAQILEISAEIDDAPVQLFGGGARLGGGAFGHDRLLQCGEDRE